MISPNSGEGNKKQRTINVIIAILVAQVGLISLVIILAALFGGMWLDNQFGTRSTYTIIFLLASVPVSLLTMLMIARSTIKKIRAEASRPKFAEEQNRIGTDQSN